MDFAERVANLYANQGIEIAIVGMTVVFVALTVIAIIIALLPHLITLINKVVPEAVPAAKKVVQTSSDEAVAVALVMAHHQNSQQ